MFVHYIVGTALALFAIPSHGTELESKFPQLGKNSLEDLKYNFEVTVDDNCDYTLTIEFQHNDNFDVGDNVTCTDPTFETYDGLPLQAGRYMYEQYPQYAIDATGFDHASIDYNPCGHPDGGWFSAHYDLHFYMVTPEFRATEVVCDTIPNIPVCNPGAQTTETGQRFFELERVDQPAQVSKSAEGQLPAAINMPEGFELGITHAVINMGMHNFDHSLVPATPDEWEEPSLIMVSHGSVIAFEPMIPFRFVEGDEDHSFFEEIVYVQQTITTLPYNLRIDYDASTGFTTVVMQGKSTLCKDDFEAAKMAFENPSDETPGENDPVDPSDDEDEESSAKKMIACSSFVTLLATVLSLLL